MDVQATPEDAFSYIQPIGYRNSPSCGYCRRSGNNQPAKRHSYYARTTSMTAACYQTLIDRCWRRSGTLLYRPNQRAACCPHYTIRLDSGQFKPTKDQRQAINKFNRFVLGEDYANEVARRYPRTREEARRRDTEFDLVARLRDSEHQALKRPPEPAHVFAVTLEDNSFTEEKYAVFENYQRVVHHESPSDISRDGFRRFLCSSPLRRATVTTADGREKRLGSYHQCYRLDGKLVAIGVLDLLPDCVSAVYFLYHESFHKWSPGKLGALREIGLAAEGGYRWWYPGFYIHTCPKMRYKTDYSPQQILDPGTMNWIDLTKDVLAKFDNHGYLDLDSLTKRDPTSLGASSAEVGNQREEIMADVDEEDSDEDTEVSLFSHDMPGIPSMDELRAFDFNQVPVRLRRGYCLAGDLFEWGDEDISEEHTPKSAVAQLVATVGPELMPAMCLDFTRG
ncbi:arginine-tRNA-protein transferase [Xylariaceae sp. FL0804]|nr:arginine-tRNA-protein transferase [Xylariaceae sp. FL0804]